MKRRIMPWALALALALLAGVPGTRAAAAALDQHQDQVTRGLSVRVAAWQTVRVGLGGTLVQVDLPLCAAIQKSVVQLAVVSQSGRLASTALIVPHSYSDCFWYTFAFAAPLRAAAGDLLRLHVTALRGQAPLWGASGGGSDPYPAGSGSWGGHRIDDFAFRTFMATA